MDKSTTSLVNQCHILAPAGNKEPRGHSFTPPSPLGWGGESEGKGKN